MSVGVYSNENNDYERAILESVNMNDIETAINTNDYELALKNFKKVIPVLLQITKSKVVEQSYRDWNGEMQIRRNTVMYTDSPFTDSTVDQFYYFSKMICKKGLGYWFPHDPTEHWIEHATYQPTNSSIHCGWEDFSYTIKKDQNGTRPIYKPINIKKIFDNLSY